MIIVWTTFSAIGANFARFHGPDFGFHWETDNGLHPLIGFHHFGHFRYGFEHMFHGNHFGRGFGIH